MAHRMWVRPAIREAKVSRGVQVVGKWTDSQRTQGSGLRAGQIQNSPCLSWAVNGSQEQGVMPLGSGDPLKVPTGCIQVQAHRREHIPVLTGVSLCPQAWSWAWAQKCPQGGCVWQVPDTEACGLSMCDYSRPPHTPQSHQGARAPREPPTSLHIARLPSER